MRFLLLLIPVIVAINCRRLSHIDFGIRNSEFGIKSAIRNRQSAIEEGTVPKEKYFQKKLLIFILPFLVAIGPFDSPKWLVEEGNRLFSEEKYDEALEKYDRATELAEDDAPLNYNRGNVLYKKGNVRDAIREYQNGAAYGDDSLKARSFYNMGNSLYLEGRYGEAAASYKEALIYDPSDADAKMNLELTLRKIEEQEQKDNREDKDNQQGEEKEKGEDKGPSGEKGEAGESTRNQGSETKKGSGKEMSKEEAERLLDSLADDDMDLQNLGNMLKSAGSRKVERDW